MGLVDRDVVPGLLLPVLGEGRVDARGLREMGIATGRARAGCSTAHWRRCAAVPPSAEGRERNGRNAAATGPTGTGRQACGSRHPRSAWLSAQALAGQLRAARSAGEGKNVQQRLRRQLARKLRTLRRDGKLNEMRRLYPEEFKGIIDGIGRGGLHR